MFESGRIMSYVFELWWLRMGDHYLWLSVIWLELSGNRNGTRPGGVCPEAEEHALDAVRGVCW